jgi:hypothetical protein
VVECTALEMRHGGNSIGGSNPSLSANLFSEIFLFSISWQCLWPARIFLPHNMPHNRRSKRLLRKRRALGSVARVRQNSLMSATINSAIALVLEAAKAAIERAEVPERARLEALLERWHAECGRSSAGLVLPATSHQRIAIIGAVEAGLIEPPEAEAIAKDLGCGPLAQEPAATEHDPTAKPFWSLQMAVAWIASRDFSVVRQRDEDFRAACQDWKAVPDHFLPRDGHPQGFLVKNACQLVQRRRTNLIYYLLDSFPDGINPAKGKAQLWAALAEGKLDATGFATGERQKLDAYLWQDLEPQLESSGSDIEVFEARDPKRASQKPAIRWQAVTVNRDDVLQVWPTPTVESTSTLDLYRTGGPGKPSAIHLVVAEFGRRQSDGLTQPILKNEAAALREWLTKNHPSSPNTTAKTIANRIRNEHRAFRTSMLEKPQ